MDKWSVIALFGIFAVMFSPFTFRDYTEAQVDQKVLTCKTSYANSGRSIEEIQQICAKK